MPTEGARKAAVEITRFYGKGIATQFDSDIDKLAELIDQHTLGLGRSAIVSPMPDGDIKVDYRACGKVIDTLFYLQQQFSKFGSVAFLMGAHVTP